MAVKQLLKNVVRIATVFLLMDQTTIKVEACKCLGAGLYEGFESADVVIHATALNRSELDMYDLNTYTLDTITLYKEEPNVTYAQEVSFTTPDLDSSLCGVLLKLGREYLIGLYRTNDTLTATTCGLVWEWSWVSDEDKVSLEGGCKDDPCDGLCDKFQECLYYPSGPPGVYYCADVCSPNRCGTGEVCTLEYGQCQDLPCPEIAVCTASSN